MKNYTDFLGVKWGEWLDVTEMPEIAILQTRQAHVSSNRVTSSTFFEFNFDVFLLTENHLYKVQVASAGTYEEAQQIAQTITENMNVVLMPFNPQGPSRYNRR